MTLVKVSHLLNQGLMVWQGQIFKGWVASFNKSVGDSDSQFVFKMDL